MFRYFPAVFLLSIVLGGCAIPPPAATPAAAMCNFRMHRLELPLSDAGGDKTAPDADAPAPTDQGGQLTTLESEIRSALDTTAAAPGAEPLAVLALSGGSQHGAFGAGFLDGWRRARPGQRMPEFGVVTGISTGSILSTFAFIGDTERAVTRYSILNERELLTPVVRTRRDGSMSPFEIFRVLRRGAVADLAPLRNTLLVEISPSVMAEVARRHALGRRLYVGAVDLDSGQAMAMDLTDMAARFVAAGTAGGAETAEQLRLRNCYVDAIVASSSAPLAAVPVFIDNSMYVDGGMRFGMFSDDVIFGVQGHDKVTGQVTPVFVIANGDLETEPKCGRVQPAMCTAHPPSGRNTDPRTSWNILNVALRSEDVLVNQVYRFSADRIVGERKFNNNIWFARIRPNALDHQFAMDNPALGTGTRSCRDWRAEDESTLHPIQFYPRYMHCLINYGQARGQADDWNIKPAPEPQPVADGAPSP